MRTACYAETGPARRVSNIVEAADPAPAAGDVLVRVVASGVNPSEVKKRAGWMKGPAAFPRIIPHADGAGVDRVRIGEQVWLWNAHWDRACGSAAQCVAPPAALATNGSIAACSSTSAPRFEIDCYAFAAKAAQLRMAQVYLLEPQERAAAHAGLRALREAGRPPITIAARFPLERIAEAHEMQETGRPLGNAVIDVTAPDHTRETAA
jgi:NADPH:quinone reductase-like Zn-dependent oxidoreductase